MPLALGLTLLGCGPGDGSDDDGIPVPDRPPVAFEGTPDPKLAGVYKTNSGMIYTLDKSGNSEFKGTKSTPNGPQATSGHGQWAVKGDTIYFKDENGVVPYLYQQKGKQLILSMSGTKTKHETVFTRQ